MLCTPFLPAEMKGVGVCLAGKTVWLRFCGQIRRLIGVHFPWICNSPVWDIILWQGWRRRYGYVISQLRGLLSVDLSFYASIYRADVRCGTVEIQSWHCWQECYAFCGIVFVWWANVPTVTLASHPFEESWEHWRTETIFTGSSITDSSAAFSPEKKRDNQTSTAGSV